MKPHFMTIPMAVAAFVATGCQTSPLVPDGQQISAAPAESPPPAEDAATVADARTATIWVKGVACPFCVTNIDRQLALVPGVERVWVDLPTGRVWVTLAENDPATREQLVQAIDDSGFTLDRVEMPR